MGYENNHPNEMKCTQYEQLPSPWND
jgi:hypothetical protein